MIFTQLPQHIFGMEIECNPFDSKSLHRNYEACIWWQCYQMALLYLLGYFEISASILPRFHMLNSRNFWKFEHPNFSSRFILQKVGLVHFSDFWGKTGFGKNILSLKKTYLGNRTGNAASLTGLTSGHGAVRAAFGSGGFGFECSHTLWDSRS